VAVEYLTIGDYLVVAEATLGIPTEELARYANLVLVDSALHAPAAGTGDIDFYPDLVTNAAVLCSRLVRNHPLPDGNKRVAYACMRTFLDLNGCDIVRDYTDEAAEDNLVSLIFDLAAKVVNEQQFEEWLRPRIVTVSESP
jgi:death on curing protein